MNDLVKDYYGRVLQSSRDLRTSACCDADSMPGWLRPHIERIHPEVRERYYGCGLVCPPLLEGCRVLDLGCGAGRDVYALAQLVGAHGEVIGIDMTPEQLDVARRHQDYHRRLFGFDNVTFVDGDIEQLGMLGLEPGSFDVIVSNCVVNLCPDKDAVLRGAHMLLKPGGEFYFSDVYADRRVPDALRRDPVFYGECLGGALYWNDFLRVARNAGFTDPRQASERPLDIGDADLRAQAGEIRFASATWRLFRLEGLETACEDYGQAVRYRGSVPGNAHRFDLDRHHAIESGRVFPVCGNTWRMLAETRFNPHFEFVGDFNRHYGLFAGCAGDAPFARSGGVPAAAGCC